MNLDILLLDLWEWIEEAQQRINETDNALEKELLLERRDLLTQIRLYLKEEIEPTLSR